jgi:hypothetical protein
VRAQDRGGHQRTRRIPAGWSSPEGIVPLHWTTCREALQVCLHRPHLRRTAGIALVVGTILFAINQLDVVLAGRATAGVWVKVALTYLVPFCVSNWGVLVATRRARR